MRVSVRVTCVVCVWAVEGGPSSQTCPCGARAAATAVHVHASVLQGHPDVVLTLHETGTRPRDHRHAHEHEDKRAKSLLLIPDYINVLLLMVMM